MPATAVLFPGQGSLTPFAAEHARAVCPELVALAGNLAGDDPFLRAAQSTRFAQPAIFVASIAGWYERKHELGGIAAMAGHSLGELSALAAAGALEVEDALELVVLRGAAMDAAGGADGTMVALLGADHEQARELADRHGVTVANDNAPGQLVLSGPTAAIAAVTDDARAGGLRALGLDVTGAFHSPAMQPAVEEFRAAVAAVEFRAPHVPVVSGLTAQPFVDPADELARALVCTVRWRDVMRHLVEQGISRFVDIGPGRVLDRLASRNLKDIGAHAVA